jgi:hypothetical protein
MPGSGPFAIYGNPDAMLLSGNNGGAMNGNSQGKLLQQQNGSGIPLSRPSSG